MAKKIRTRRVRIKLTKEAKFAVFSISRKSLDIENIKKMRALFSDEKARILFAIKEKKPQSIYDLAKILKRDFKAVRKDISLLESYGFVRLVKGRKGKRRSLKPVLNVDEIIINFIL